MKAKFIPILYLSSKSTIGYENFMKEYQFQIDLDLKHDKTHLTSKTHFTFIVILFYPIFYFAIKLPKVAVQRPNTIQSQFQMGSDFCFEALVFPMNKL